jgi:hypothetical protein
METHKDKDYRPRFVCEEAGCNYTGLSKSGMRLHVRRDHLNWIPPERRYLCECGKVFTKNSSYHLHVNFVHKKIKKHVCTICQKRYFAKKQLKDHMKVHVSLKS